MSDKSKDDSATTAAHKVIDAFGGIRPMAQKLGVAASTVQGWKERGVIPSGRHQKILEIVKADNLALSAEDVAASAQMPEDPTSADDKPAAAPKPAVGETSGGKAPEKSEAAAPTPPKADAGSAKAAPSSAPAPAAGRSGWEAPFIGGVLAVLVGIGITVVTHDIWRPLIGDESAADSGAVTDLENRIAALESQPDASAPLAALRNELASAIAEASEANAKAERALSQGANAVSEDSIAALEAKVAENLAARGADLRDLVNRFEALEDRMTQRPVAAQDLSLTLAIGSLRERLYRGLPFTDILDFALEASAGRPAVRSELQALGEAAENGVLRIVRLQESFQSVSRDIIAAAAGDGENNALLAGIKRRVSQIVTVRRLDGAEEGSPELAVALAEDALKAGNLGDALAALEGLPGKARAAAEPWFTEAERRFGAEQALEKATDAFLADLANDAAR